MSSSSGHPQLLTQPAKGRRGGHLDRLLKGERDERDSADPWGPVERLPWIIANATGSEQDKILRWGLCKKKKKYRNTICKKSLHCDKNPIQFGWVRA